MKLSKQLELLKSTVSTSQLRLTFNQKIKCGRQQQKTSEKWVTRSDTSLPKINEQGTGKAASCQQSCQLFQRMVGKQDFPAITKRMFPKHSYRPSRMRQSRAAKEIVWGIIYMGQPGSSAKTVGNTMVTQSPRSRLRSDINLSHMWTTIDEA